MLEHLIDIVFAVIAIVTIVLFAKRGFIQSFLQYSKSFLSAYISYRVGPTVGNFLYDKIIYNGIFNWVYGKVDSFVSTVTGSVDVDSIMNEVPFIVRQFVNSDSLKDKYGQKVENINVAAKDFSEFVSQPFANLLSNLLAYLLIFLLAMLCFMILGKLLEQVSKLPVIRGLNFFFGLAFGIVAAFILLSALTYGLSIIIALFGNILHLEELLDNSFLFGFFDRVHLFDLF